MRKRNRDYIRCEVADKYPTRFLSDSGEDVSDDELVKYYSVPNYYSSVLFSPLSITSRNDAKEELERRFRVRNLITRRQFAEDHWQTLFHLEYPMLVK